MYASLAASVAAKCRSAELQIAIVRQWFEDWRPGLDMPEQLTYNLQVEVSELLEVLLDGKKNEK